MTRRSSLADVAREAGVSKTTAVQPDGPGHADILGWLEPAVTAIEVPVAAMCAATVRLLFDRPPDRPDPQRILIPETLIPRATTGPAKR